MAMDPSAPASPKQRGLLAHLGDRESANRVSLTAGEASRLIDGLKGAEKKAPVSPPPAAAKAPVVAPPPPPGPSAAERAATTCERASEDDPFIMVSGWVRSERVGIVIEAFREARKP